MLYIALFLEKFKKFGADKTLQKEKVGQILEKIAGINIPKENLEIKFGILYLKTSPVIRQEIFFKKTAVLAAIASEGLYDIR